MEKGEPTSLLLAYTASFSTANEWKRCKETKLEVAYI